MPKLNTAKEWLMRTGVYSLAVASFAGAKYFIDELNYWNLHPQLFLREANEKLMVNLDGATRLATYCTTFGLMLLGYQLQKDTKVFTKIENKISSNLISPIKEKILRRNADYVATMGYNCQV